MTGGDGPTRDEQLRQLDPGHCLGSGVLTPGFGPECPPQESPPRRVQVSGRVPDRPRTGLQLVLLGTAGGPVVWRGRYGISTLLVIEGTSYVVDLGMGATQRYRMSGARWEDLRHVFITHMHSDHTIELPHALLFPWDLPRESYERPLNIWGPGGYNASPSEPPPQTEAPPRAGEKWLPGLTSAIDALMSSVFRSDITIRQQDEGRRDPRANIIAHDISLPASSPAHPQGPRSPRMKPFVLWEESRVRVTATLVDHAKCFPSFAFRFDTDYGSIVVGGDTCPSENLCELAEGADVLIHEVINIDRCIEAIPAGGGLLDELVEHWETSHTRHDMVGKVAARANVKNLVLSHIVPGHTHLMTELEWLQPIAAQFKGNAYVGRDMDVFSLA